jgi:hypothetical protein
MKEQRLAPTCVLAALIALATACATACSSPCSCESPLAPHSPLSPLPIPSVATNATLESVSSPTAAQQPTPTVTRPPTATSTPRPTPTQAPRPRFPEEAAVPDGWPSLPSNLYFIRDGSLWMWSSGGGGLRQIVAAPEESDALAGKGSYSLAAGGLPPQAFEYRVTPDGRYVVYSFIATSSPASRRQLAVLDQAGGDTYLVPTAGEFGTGLARHPEFDITPDGQYVVYLAWNVHPTTSSRSPGRSSQARSPLSGGARYATVFAVDVHNPNREFELGYCAARSEHEWEIWCEGFVMSPDGSSVAFTDGRGLWVSGVPDGSPRLIAEHRHRQGFCGVWRVHNWSPDGRHLLIDVGCYEGGYSAVMDAETGVPQEIPHSWSYPSPYVGISWTQGGDGLLVAHIGDQTAAGPAHLAVVSVQNPSEVTQVISYTWRTDVLPVAPSPNDVFPTEPKALPDSTIAFANQQCVDSQAMTPGIYTTAPSQQAEFNFVLPLPHLPCYATEGGSASWGAVLWSPDGTAFMYFERGAQAPSLLGFTDGSVLWDVREVLAGGRAFQWQPPYSGYWQ